MITTKVAYAGNVFSDDEMKDLTIDQINESLRNRAGKANNNIDVMPGTSLPFMIVFEKPPTENIAQFQVEALSSSAFSEKGETALAESVSHEGAASRAGAKDDGAAGSNEIARDGVYVAYADGVVRDAYTGLEWVVGPDRDMNWNEAKSWVESLKIDGGGWRMPTLKELEGLLEKRHGSGKMTPLLKTSGWWVWSGDLEGSTKAWIFYIPDGYNVQEDQNRFIATRAFAVRSRGIGY